MESAAYYLGIDVGTSAIKVVMTDSAFHTIAVQESSYSVCRRNPKWVELNAREIWGHLLNCLERICSAVNLSEVAGIGLSCLCPGLVALGKDGELLAGPILYSDKRSELEAAQILECVGADRLFQITANSVMSGAISASSILWIKRHLPEIYEQTECFGHVNTYLLSKMTGNEAIDPSNASYTGLFEIKAGDAWSEELCRLTGIDIQKLPPIKRSFDICGGVKDVELIRCGIKPGTPVVIGGADTVCAAVAGGILQDGDMFESVGTTDVLTVCVDKPIFSRQLINRCHAVEGKWVYQGVLSSAASTIDWAADIACLQGEGRYQKYEELARTSAPGSNGLLFLPYLNGERSPVWDANARGVLLGISPETQKADVLRAALEGCAYAMRQFLEIADGMTNNKVQTILQTGGGSRNLFWTQIKSDIMGCSFDVQRTYHMAPLGAAILAAVGVGAYPSVETAAARLKRESVAVICPHVSEAETRTYAAGYRKFLKLYPSIKDCFCPRCFDSECD